MSTTTIAMGSSSWGTSAVKPIAVHGTGSARTPNSVAACASDSTVTSSPARMSHQPMALPGTRVTSSAPTPRRATSVARIRTAGPVSDAGGGLTAMPTGRMAMLATASSHASRA